MTIIASSSRFSALGSARAPTHRLYGARSRIQRPTRSFSDQAASSNGRGKENASVRGTRTGTENAGGKTEGKAKSPYAKWYGDFLPGMIPIALLGSAVYIGLQLVQTKLATEKYLYEANERIAQLEQEIKRLQSAQRSSQSKSKDRSSRASSGGSPQGGDGNNLGSDKTRSSSSRWWRWWW